MMLRMLTQVHEQLVLRLQKVPNFDGLQGYDDLLLATTGGRLISQFVNFQVRGNLRDKLFA